MANPCRWRCAAATTLTTVCLVGSVLFGGPSEDSAHRIRLRRDEKAGERFHVRVSQIHTEQSKTLTGQKLLKTEDKKVHTELEAVSTILRVDEKKRASHVRLEIIRFVQRPRGADQDHVLLAKGAVVQAFVQKGKDAFLVNGKPVVGQTHEALDEMISLPKRPTSEKEVFGTSERKKPGDRWPIRNKIAASIWKLPDPKAVSGHMKLERVEQVDGVPVLTILGEFAVTRFMPKQKDGVIYRKARAAGTVQRRYTDDPPISRFNETTHMTVELDVQTQPRKNVPAVNIQSITTDHTERTVRLLP